METTTTETAPPALQAVPQVDEAPKPKGRPPRSFFEQMPCRLTVDDIAKISDEIVAADEEVTSLEDERKQVNDGFKHRIGLAEQRRSDLIGKVRSKTELRDVELIEEFIFETKTVRVYRSDDPEKKAVRTRAMTTGERQEELPLGAKKEKKSAKANGESKPAEGEPAKGEPDAPPPEAETAAPPSATDIQNPEAVLNGEAPPAEPSQVKRVKRGRKKS